MKTADWILLAGLFFRILLSLLVAYFGYENALELDAQSFVFEAEAIARSGDWLPFSVGINPYLNVFGASVMLFGHTLFVGCILSCSAWWLSGRLYIATITRLSADNRQLAIFTAIFAFWPTAIPFTFMPLREAFQLLFVNLALFGMVNMLLTRRKLYWFPIVGGVVMAGLLHGALMVTGVGFLAMTFLGASARFNDKFPVGKFAAAAIAGIVILYFGYGIFVAGAYDLSGGALATIENYQNGVASIYARSVYKTQVAITSISDAVALLPFGFWQYLTEPAPWKAQTVGDIVLSAENLVRVSIVAIALRAIFSKKKNVDRSLLVILFITYFGQEFIWSLGTVNWGTSSRHHVPAMGNLLILPVLCGVFARRLRMRNNALQSRPTLANSKIGFG